MIMQLCRIEVRNTYNCSALINNESTMIQGYTMQQIVGTISLYNKIIPLNLSNLGRG